MTGRFLRWLLGGGHHPDDATHAKWLAEEEFRQLAEVRERLERVERQLERTAEAVAKRREA